MTTRTRLMIVMGTRPEVIKLAPVVTAARKQPDRFDTVVVTTSQHREMLDQMLTTFGIHVDVDLDIMRHDQNLAQVTTAALDGLDPTVRDVRPDCVIVQGDTTSTLMGAMAAFYNGVPVAHVEAGLRTFDKRQPFPEEINRRLTTQMTDVHFAPTELSRQNLEREGCDPDTIHVTGNTCVDALFMTLDRLQPKDATSNGTRKILLTSHRRENHGGPLGEICDAVLELANRFSDVEITYPVHMSPRVRDTVFGRLGNHERIKLVEPLDYDAFVLAMHASDLILTDSGGIQEEAPSLGKPVLVLRENTERPEGVDAGTLRLVGTDREAIVDEASRLLEDQDAYREMAQACNPYGDGQAADRILTVLGEEMCTTK